MKNRTLRYAIQGLGLITLALAANTLVNAQSTHTVCASGCDYASIQAAVNASSPGDTVQVQAGTYSDSLITINKALTLNGAQAGQDARLRGNKSNTPNPAVETIMTSSAGPYMFQLNALNITIDGFWFQDLGVYGGIENTSANTDHLTIKNNVFFAKASTNCSGVGNIQLAGGGPTAHYFDFENNYVTMNLSSEPSGGGCAYFLLMEATMDHGTIRNNYFNTDNVAFGPFGQRTGWVIDGNEFDGTLPAPLGDYWSFGFNANLGDVKITNNNVHKMYVGLGQISVVGGTISGNTFNDNQYAAFQLWGGEYGTVVSGNVPIQDNVFVYNGVACTSYADASHGVRLRATDYPNPSTDDPNGIDATTIHFRSNYFQDLHVGGCGQAWAIRNNAGPSSPPTTYADAAYNWWGQNSGPAANQTDGYATTDPYIANYTNDPAKIDTNGFWPLITTSTAINSASPEPSAPGQEYDLSVVVTPGLGGSLASLTELPGQVTATNTSDSSDTCTSSSNSASVDDPSQYVFSCALTAATTGNRTFTATFTNSGTVPIYNTSTSDSYSHSVNTLPTTVTQWPTASTISYGQTLLSSSLTGGSASVEGGFAFTDPTLAPGLGTASQSVTFTPTDPAYSTVVGSVSVTVGQATPTITISNIPGDAVYGGSFLASISYNGDGTTSLASNSPTICTVSGFNVRFIAVGTCSLTPSATQGTNYTAITGSTQTFPVGQAQQAALTVIAKSPATYNTSQKLSTTGGSGTGAVTYNISTPTVCSVTGNTLLMTSGTGTCSVTATKAADTHYLSTTSSQASVVAQKASTPISINNIPKNGVNGNAFTPSFSYSLDGTEVAVSSTTGVCTVSGGTVNFIAVGTCSLRAMLTGSANLNDVTGNAQSFSVIKATPTVIVSSSNNPSYYGDTVDFITAILPSTATGNVTFYDGKTLLGTKTLSGGQATLTVAALKVGSHSITVVYGGDSNFSTATSAAFTQTVSKAAPSVALGPLSGSSAYGAPVTFTATASGVVSGAVPTGMVTFKNGGATLGNAPLNNGIASFTTSTLAVGGPYTITAVYAGDPNYSTATSNSVSQTVTKATPTMTLTTSAASVKFGTNVTFTATLPATATGSATFYDGATTLGSATVTKGVAKFSTKTLTKGTHTITASYSGDFNFTTLTSNPAVTETVK